MDCNADVSCNCTCFSCPRHKKCCECIEYHRKKQQLPACYFDDESEKTWDRSISFYNKVNGII